MKTEMTTMGEVGRLLNRFKPITDRSKVVLLVWFSVFACFGVCFCIVFTFYVSRRYLVSRVAIFWERAAHSFYHIFSFFFDLL